MRAYYKDITPAGSAEKAVTAYSMDVGLAICNSSVKVATKLLSLMITESHDSTTAMHHPVFWSNVIRRAYRNGSIDSCIQALELSELARFAPEVLDAAEMLSGKRKEYSIQNRRHDITDRLVNFCKQSLVGFS